MLTLTFSNRFHELREALLGAMAIPPQSPFAVDEIIVPSAAIRRNLELEMANRFGVCAQVQFSYLGTWVWQQMAKVSAGDAISPLSGQTLPWQIYGLLSDTAFVAAHPRLVTYLSGGDDLKRFELATQTALQIDHTSSYRPNWLDAWANGELATIPSIKDSILEDQLWQADLWRRLIAQTRTLQHPGAALRRLKSLDAKATNTLSKNNPVHIFCLPTIPPLYLRILNQLGKWMEVHLYVLNPCITFWSDIVDPRQLASLKMSGKLDYHEVGNPLLASWGKQARAMIAVIQEIATGVSRETCDFIPNAPDDAAPSLLAQLQNSILARNDLQAGSLDLLDTDRSLEVHSCHSLTRELEVLQDQLLALFATPDAPMPQDILVVTPDLEKAAPLIDAVFGTVEEKRRIPYIITGLGNTRTNSVAIALLDLLAILPSRITANQVFALLQQPLVAQRFQLSNEDLKTVHRWMMQSGMRWGLDAEHRAGLDLPATDAYTLSDGMHRLFLSYALPADCDAPFGVRLPTGNPEGSDAAVLGRFWQFMQSLQTMHKIISGSCNAEEWRQHMLTLIVNFMAPQGNQLDEWREVQKHLQELCDNMLDGGDHPVPITVFQAALKSVLDNDARGGVPSGAVVFTSMSSLRNLPYRMICVIGLNDGAFPAANRAMEFDLLVEDYQLGDRQRSEDDRNLFLDLLLAAQDRLYLSYTGRSVRDNSPIPPSVLISELFDVISNATGKDATKRLRIEHPLQAFSMRYFKKDTDKRILSSNREYYDALHEKLRAPILLADDLIVDDDEDEEENDDLDEDVLPFFYQPLSPTDAHWREVTLDQLIRFFRNPSRYLLQQRLGIIFPEQEDALDDDEPFLPERDEQRSLADRILPLCLKGVSTEAIFDTACAGTEYPPGEMGKALLEAELQALSDFATRIKADLAPPCMPAREMSLDFVIEDEAWRLNHRFDDLRQEGLIRHRFDKVRAGDYLSGWLQHLFLNAVAPIEVSCTTRWHSRDGDYVLEPLENARDRLHAIMLLYRRGLCEPLHFYPRSAWEYIKTERDLSKAETRWRGGQNPAFGESQDPAYRQALRGINDPLDADFEENAQIVFEDMVQHIIDPRLE